MSSLAPTARVLGSDADHRRRRRELMRAHHPDLGGDPAVFVEMLRRLDEAAVRGDRVEPPTEVRFVKRRRWWVPTPPRPFRAHRPQRVH